MPIGILVDTAVVIVGGVAGVFIGKHIPNNIKDMLTTVFGYLCLTLGITLAVGVNSLVPVGIALILGTIIGESIHLEDKLTSGVAKLTNILSKESSSDSLSGVMSLIPLFCINSTMVVGGMNESLGEHTVLLVKSVLDLFTALVFAASLGGIVAFLSIPLFAIGMLFFGLSSLLLPLISPAMMADLNACGGVHLLMVATTVIGLKRFKVNNVIPALIFVLPLSWLWGLIPL